MRADAIRLIAATSAQEDEVKALLDITGAAQAFEDAAAADAEAGASVTAMGEPSPLLRKSDQPAGRSPGKSRLLANRALVGAFALLPAASAGITYALTERSRAMRYASVAAGVAAGLALARWQLVRFFTPQPDYALRGRLGNIEIRRYAPMVVAETTLSRRNWDGAIDEGFRRLAGYIFGANSARQRFEMTAPVTTVFHPAEEHTVSFVMPVEQGADSLPVPRDDRIHRRAVGPARRGRAPLPRFLSPRTRAREDPRAHRRHRTSRAVRAASRALPLTIRPPPCPCCVATKCGCRSILPRTCRRGYPRVCSRTDDWSQNTTSPSIGYERHAAIVRDDDGEATAMIADEAIRCTVPRAEAVE
jgi:hypothetical protein